MAKKSGKAETAKAGGVRINPDLEKLARPIVDVHPDPHNAKKHTQRDIETIASSLREHGQQTPIVTTRDGVVIKGNGTLAAALLLGWDRIAAVTYDGEGAAAYAVIDNRTSELSGWNTDALLDQLRTLEPLSVGFSSGEVQDLVDAQTNPFVTQKVDVGELKFHPRNYKAHPDDQLEHIMRSIEQHGFYRNVVVARDNTVLAGAGVVQAARKMGRLRIPVIRLDLDPNEPRALRVIVSDNEIGNLAEVNDRALTELLKEILHSDDTGLAGTGFSEEQLAALVLVTRNAAEIESIDEAAQWAGLPEFSGSTAPFKVAVSFDTEENRAAFLKVLGVPEFISVSGTNPRGRELGKTISFWWPLRKREDLSAVAYKATDGTVKKGKARKPAAEKGPAEKAENGAG